MHTHLLHHKPNDYTDLYSRSSKRTGPIIIRMWLYPKCNVMDLERGSLCLGMNFGHYL